MPCNALRNTIWRSIQLSVTNQFHLHQVAMASNGMKRKSSSLAAASTSPESESVVKQHFDYFLVLDFEATCDNTNQPKPQEIIEFPVLKVNARTSQVESVFHQYVLPEVHPRLTPFCTELTGIVQDMVDNQPHISEVLENFHKWMNSEKLLEPNTKSIFVTCGDWDLKVMLPKQCGFFGISSQSYLKQWINIKKAYAEMTGVFPKGMFPMLKDLQLKHTGRHHSGIDDSHNIANILTAMMGRGYVFHQTGSRV